VARNELFSTARPNLTKIAILITDGEANRERRRTIPEANKTKAQGVEVFCVGITNDVSGFVLFILHTPSIQTVDVYSRLQLRF